MKEEGWQGVSGHGHGNEGIQEAQCGSMIRTWAWRLEALVKAQQTMRGRLVFILGIYSRAETWSDLLGINLANWLE